MYNRRKFLKNSGAAALAAMMFSDRVTASFLSNKAMRSVGLQLFTFFNQIDDDVEGTLKKIAAIGYKEIESAFSKKGDYYGMKPKEFSKVISDLGMSWKSHHVLGAPFKMPANAKPITDANGNPIKFAPVRNLKENMQELVDEIAETGIPYLVCANTPIDTLDDVKNSIEVLQKTGEACKKSNIQFCYHNHDMEFKSVGGEVPYYMMLSQLDADKVKFELDVAWSIKGGADPIELFKKHQGRFPLWHIKDLDATHQNILPVGEGTIDYKTIFANASTAGMQHFFVEHDMPKDAFASITISYNNLQKIVS